MGTIQHGFRQKHRKSFVLIPGDVVGLAQAAGHDSGDEHQRHVSRLASMFLCYGFKFIHTPVLNNQGRSVALPAGIFLTQALLESHAVGNPRQGIAQGLNTLLRQELAPLRCLLRNLANSNVQQVHFFLRGRIPCWDIRRQNFLHLLQSEGQLDQKDLPVAPILFRRGTGVRNDRRDVAEQFVDLIIIRFRGQPLADGGETDL